MKSIELTLTPQESADLAAALVVAIQRDIEPKAQAWRNLLQRLSRAELQAIGCSSPDFEELEKAARARFGG